MSFNEKFIIDFRLFCGLVLMWIFFVGDGSVRCRLYCQNFRYPYCHHAWGKTWSTCSIDSVRFILCISLRISYIFIDGVNEVKALMQLTVRLVTEEMLFNSITVRLDDMTEEAFLSPLLTFFIEGLAAIIPCPKESIFVFSIQVSKTV